MGFEQDKYSPETKMFDEQNPQKERIRLPVASICCSAFFAVIVSGRVVCFWMLLDG